MLEARLTLYLSIVGSFSDKLAAALNLPPVAPPGPIQLKFNEYRKHLRNRVIKTPLPQDVHLLDENFLYWIKLEYPDVNVQGNWIGAKASVVIPLLEQNAFNETGFRMDDPRSLSLSHIPNILQTPNCIHINLRNHAKRGQGGIRGDYMYVSYYGKKQRKVAFTLLDPDLAKVILVTSFWTYRKWVQGCADMPAVYVNKMSSCSCKIEKAAG